jgi:hypothetical protein
VTWLWVISLKLELEILLEEGRASANRAMRGGQRAATPWLDA